MALDKAFFINTGKDGRLEDTGEDELAMAGALAATAVTAGGGRAVAQDERNPSDPTSWGKVGRNEPCPCGSGKKFKHCHGKFA